MIFFIYRATIFHQLPLNFFQFSTTSYIFFFFKSLPIFSRFLISFLAKQFSIIFNDLFTHFSKYRVFYFDSTTLIPQVEQHKLNSCSMVCLSKNCRGCASGIWIFYFQKIPIQKPRMVEKSSFRRYLANSMLHFR